MQTVKRSVTEGGRRRDEETFVDNETIVKDPIIEMHVITNLSKPDRTYAHQREPNETTDFPVMTGQWVHINSAL